jgi:plasmid stability protein
MPSITVKNIPPEVYEKLKQAAQVSHRSLNGEIIACLERAVASRPIDPEALLARARMLREKTAAYQITDEEFDQAKNAGRL